MVFINLVKGTELLQLHVRGDEWDSKTKGEETEVDDSVWNFSVVNLDWDVRVNTFFEMGTTLLGSGRKGSSGG